MTKPTNMSNKTVVKLNNVPHGFYEEEMKKYFSQFGKVKNVLVIRSKKTHKSRGFAFVEFYVPQIAKIVAEAMHNYLFFNNVLKCRQMDRENLPRNLFKTVYKGPTTVQANKDANFTKTRDPKHLKLQLKKIRKIERELQSKYKIEFKCHIINAPQSAT